MTESEVRVAEADVSGEMSRSVAAGVHVLQVGSPHGGVVTAARPGEQPQPQLVEPPLNLHPLSLVEKLDREAETDTGMETLRTRRPFEVHGEAGSGRTVLLVDLLTRVPSEAHGNRVLYVSARGQTVVDLLQQLFECFYRCDVPFKPTDVQLRRYLGNVDALVALDDVQLSREELEQLLVDAPRCTFAVATAQRILWEGRSVALGGLPEEAALTLLERALDQPLRAPGHDTPSSGRPSRPAPEPGPVPAQIPGRASEETSGHGFGQRMDPVEREAALAVCRRLGGHPLSILQAAADARMEGLSLTDLASDAGANVVRSEQDAQGAALERAEQLSEPQRSVMGLLAAVGGGPLGAELVRSCTGIEDAVAVLRSLRARGLVNTDGASWTLTAPATPAMQDALEAGRWRVVAAEHVVAWSERRGRQPEQVAEERNAVVAVLGWAERSRRWQDVLRLARAVEGPLALARTWGLWRSVLEAALSAAREAGDRAAEAWALHQLGTRALCLDDLPEARRRLSEALRIRESLSDHQGADVTRGNIELLDLPPRPLDEPAPPVGGARRRGRPLRTLRTLLQAGAGVVAVAALAWVVWWAWRPPEPLDIVIVDRASVPFADQPVGTVSDPMRVKLTNRGDGQVLIDTVGLTGANDHDFVAQEHGCTAAPLDPDETCTVEVRFTPREAGDRTASVVVLSRGSPVSSVVLTGTGTAGSALR